MSQLQTSKEHRVVICKGVYWVTCRESLNLLQYPVRWAFQSTGEAQRGEVSIWENRELFLSSFHLTPCLTKVKSGEFWLRWIIGGLLLLKLLALDIWRDESGLTDCFVGLFLFKWMHIGCAWLCLALTWICDTDQYCVLAHSSVEFFWRRDEYVSGKMHDSLLFYCILQIQPLMMKLPT